MAGLIDFFRFHRWANELVIATCAELGDDVLNATVPGTYGAIADTLVHQVASQEGFVAAMNGGPDPGSPPVFADLRERSRISDEVLIAIVESRRPDEILSGEFGGRAYRMELIVPLMQSINHGIEHRTQVCSILGTHGVAPPWIDVWGFIDVFAAQSRTAL